jgi:hypothetical protein
MTINQEVTIIGGQFEGKCQSCDIFMHRAKGFKAKFHQNGGNHNNFQKNMSNDAYSAIIVVYQDMLSVIAKN